jgi:hypothetical protein
MFSVQAQSESVALSNATAPPTRHGIGTRTPATQVSRVSVDVTIAVSPAVLELQVGDALDSSCTVYTPFFGSKAADDVPGEPGPESPHPALATSAIQHNEVSPANAVSFMTGLLWQTPGAYTGEKWGVYSYLSGPTQAVRVTTKG